MSSISSCGEALSLLEEIIESSGFKVCFRPLHVLILTEKRKMSMGMSVNASSMFDNESGQYEIEAGKKLDAAALASYFSELFEGKFHLPNITLSVRNVILHVCSSSYADVHRRPF